MRILIFGLPGAGKTTLAKHIQALLLACNKSVYHLNADEVRKNANDWDFSLEGRLRQGERMATLAKAQELGYDFVICDLIAPVQATRDAIAADILIWVDTVSSSIYADTDKLFTWPEYYTFRVHSQDAEYWADYILPFLLGIDTQPLTKWGYDV
jgi:adenylylsulfate kinase